MDILAPHLEQADILDLFAGTGSVGFEALRRGANKVVFVEGHPQVARDLRKKLNEQTHLIQGALPKALKKVRGTFDLILIDAPYNDPSGPETLAIASQLLNPHGIIVAEFHHKDSYAEQYGELKQYRLERHGETAIAFYRLGSVEI